MRMIQVWVAYPSVNDKKNFSPHNWQWFRAAPSADWYPVTMVKQFICRSLCANYSIDKVCQEADLQASVLESIMTGEPCSRFKSYNRTHVRLTWKDSE